MKEYIMKTIFRIVTGKLKMTVASEGNQISAGTHVTVREVSYDENLCVEVLDMYKTVRLNYYDTNILDLVEGGVEC
jgi:hypothetical protein